MKNILLFISIMLTTLVAFGVDYSTNTMGSTWENPAHWNGGGYPDDTGDNANVSYNMTFGSSLTLSINNLSVNNIILTIDGDLTVNTLNLNNDGGRIIVNGKLTITGNVVNTGASIFTINSGASVSVGGSFDMYNGCDAVVDGSLNVTGTLNGQESGTTITGSGTVTAGTYAGAGTLFGSNPMSSLSGGTTYPVPTPVTLTYLKMKNGINNIKLIWQTASEENNDYFTIERSADGINYQTIGSVKGAGNSYVTLNYSYTDNNPVNGVSYYRLSQTDYDGKFEIFKPVSVAYLSEGEIKIGPNPASDKLSISWAGELGTSHVTIYNIIGVQVKRLILSNSNTDIDISELPAGKYMVVLSADEKTITRKIVKQ